VQRKASYLELLQCAGAMDSVSVKEASLLLKEALTNCAGYKPKQITSSGVTTLSEVEFALLVSDPEIFKKIYTDGQIQFDVAVKDIQSRRAKYASDIARLKLVLLHLSQRNWAQAGQQAIDIVIDATARLAAKNVTAVEGSLAEITNRQFHYRWSAMSERGHTHLVRLFGSSKVPFHWVFGADQLAHKLIDGQLPVSSLSPLDIVQLGQSWTLKTKEALIAAKRYKVIEAEDSAWSRQPISVLADAANQWSDGGEKLLWQHLTDFKNSAEILKALVTIGTKKFSLSLQRVVSRRLRQETYRNKSITWEQLLSSQIGSSFWQSAVKKKLIPNATVSLFAYAVIKNGVNSQTDGFVKSALATLRRTKRATHSDAVEVMRWIDVRPVDAKYVVPNSSISLFKKICDLRASDCSLRSVKQIYEASTPEQRPKLWQMQLKHVTDAAHLIELAVEGAAKGWKCDWVPRWKNVDGSVQERARALVLICRNDLNQIRQLRRLFTEEVIEEALLWASRQLPSASSFELIFLELTSCLGLRHGATIRWLLSIRNRENPAGAKFDSLYSKHEIPKKSGKMRLISAPNALLKRIQKSIAVNLLDPLGAHDAAYGFVIGRSIVGNANLHVGKPMVVNADVRNCFPSVRWPLVRAALIRDLSDRLSPLSISFLVDLCTAEGVLPIGAPTSPAILNRVLFKTDQILSEHATLRDCSYSRYADDITFSGNENSVALLGVARGVLGRIGLVLDPKKTNIFRRGRRQICTGLVVNDRVNVPRSIRRRVRAAVHAFEHGRPLDWNGELMSPSGLLGRLEFLKMVAPSTAAPLLKRLNTARPAKSKRKKKENCKGSIKTGKA
jgi:retron-type reverse transcriptase